MNTIRAIMIAQQINVVAGDFSGKAWRCSNRDDNNIVHEAFADSALPTPLGSTPLCGRKSIPNFLTDVYGFRKPPDSDRYWKVRMHGAFSMPRMTLALRRTGRSAQEAPSFNKQIHSTTRVQLPTVPRKIIQTVRRIPCPRTMILDGLDATFNKTHTKSKSNTISKCAP